MKLYTKPVSQLVAKGPRARVRLPLGITYLVIRSSMDRGSRMNVGSTTRLKSAPGRNCEMICERTGLCQCSHARLPHGAAYHFPGQAPRPRLPRWRWSPRRTICLGVCQIRTFLSLYTGGGGREKKLTGQGSAAEMRDRHGCVRKLEREGCCGGNFRATSDGQAASMERVEKLEAGVEEENDRGEIEQVRL